MFMALLSFTESSDDELQLIYSIIMSTRCKHLCLFKKAFSLSMISHGASCELVDSLAMYGLTVSSTTRLETMTALGGAFVKDKIQSHLSAGRRIATVCKLAFTASSLLLCCTIIFFNLPTAVMLYDQPFSNTVVLSYPTN